MPNPFSGGRVEYTGDEFVRVTNSSLQCEFCFEDTDEGVYFPKYKRLIWKCPNGHHNEVKDIEL